MDAHVRLDEPHSGLPSVKISLTLPADLYEALRSRCADQYGREPDFHAQLRSFLRESVTDRLDCFQCVFKDRTSK